MMPTDALAKVDLWGSYLDGKAIMDPYYGDMVCAASLTVFTITQQVILFAYICLLNSKTSKLACDMP